EREGHPPPGSAEQEGISERDIITARLRAVGAGFPRSVGRTHVDVVRRAEEFAACMAVGQPSGTSVTTPPAATLAVRVPDNWETHALHIFVSTSDLRHLLPTSFEDYDGPWLENAWIYAFTRPRTHASLRA